MSNIPADCAGWWRIVDTSTWGSSDLDVLGPALLSLTGQGDRLRMLFLLAYVNAKPTKTGVSFTWEGAWEFDQVSGSGTAALRRDGRLSGGMLVIAADYYSREQLLALDRAAAESCAMPGPFLLSGGGSLLVSGEDHSRWDARSLRRSAWAWAVIVPSSRSPTSP